jgi:hypothetical protein
MISPFTSLFIPHALTGLVRSKISEAVINAIAKPQASPNVGELRERSLPGAYAVRYDYDKLASTGYPEG